MAKKENLIGMKFNRLTVIEPDLTRKRPHWICLCDCGNQAILRSDSLKEGRQKSCGCAAKEWGKSGKIRRSHGMSRTSTHNIWSSMKQRCQNPNNHKYADYGGRGIKVCERWESFDNFLQDMGKRPSKNHSIERRENDSDYCPENCKWALPEEQMSNQRTNVVIEWNGEKKILSQWARQFKVKPDNLGYYYKRYGMEEAVKRINNGLLK